MKNRLTEEQLRLLRSNVNVEYASEHSVGFTDAFKRIVYEEKEAGKPLRDIFRENGLDPAVLGDKRIYNLSGSLNRMVKERGGIEDRRKYRLGFEAEESNDADERIRRLEHELAYTRQELEYLKKIQLADMEARKQWEEKLRQK